MALNPPKQLRSRETLDRFMLAAVHLLEDLPWGSVTVADLAAAADSSVGAFYARFPDKQALLDVLDERYADELVALFRQHMAEASARGWSLEQRSLRLARRLVRFLRRYQGVVRTLVMEARSGGSERFAARTERMNEQLPALIENFAECMEPGAATRAELRQALALSFSALREQVLFPESLPAWDRAGDEALARAVVRLFLGYLTWSGKDQP